MYEGFYEKSSGYAMAAGMLLNTMSLQMTIRYRRMRGQKAQHRNRSIQGTR